MHFFWILLSIFTATLLSLLLNLLTGSKIVSFRKRTSIFLIVSIAILIIISAIVTGELNRDHSEVNEKGKKETENEEGDMEQAGTLVSIALLVKNKLVNERESESISKSFLVPIGAGKYKDSLLDFTVDLPENYLIKLNTNESKTDYTLLEVCISLQGDPKPIMEITVVKEIEELKYQSTFLSGVFSRFPKGSSEVKEESGLTKTVIDSVFSYSNFGGMDFYSVKIITENSKGIRIEKKIYVAFVKNHPFSITTTCFTQKQVDDCFRILKSFHFNE